MSVFLSAIDLHPSWEGFFANPRVKEELKKIEGQIGTHYTPQPHLVLRFATTNLQDRICCWLGRDPYPQQGVATGRSFEVNGVSSWFDKQVNSSFKNIIKLIHKSSFDLKEGSSIEEVRKAIEQEQFLIPPPHKAFSYWEKQGVLFLNTAFTCEIGGFEQSGSHVKLWKPFFNMLLAYIVNENSSIRYALWGEARKFAKTLQKLGVNEAFLYESKHPCTNGDKGGYERNSSFLMNPIFHDTKEVLDWVYEAEAN